MEYLRLAFNTYCRSLKYGCEFIYQSLTCLLTMCLDFASDLVQVFAAFPQQTLWMMINLYDSSNSMRRDRCIAIWNEASNIESGLHDFVVEATVLIKQLDTLCMHAVTYGQNQISLSAQFKSFKRSCANQSPCPILIPIQSQMQIYLPSQSIRFSLSTTTAHHEC